MGVRSGRRLLAAIVAMATGITLVTAPPAIAEASLVDTAKLADVLLAGYVRTVDDTKTYTKHLVASAELLDWHATHPGADQKTLTEHFELVQGAIHDALPERTSLTEDHEIAGAALSVLHTVKDAAVRGPEVGKLLAALIARDVVPPTGSVRDRLGSALQISSWRAGLESAQASVWSGVGKTARGDAKFTAAWDEGLGKDIGVSAKSTAVQLSNTAVLQHHLKIEPFLQVQTNPDQLRIVTDEAMAKTIEKTVEQRNLWFNELKNAKPEPTKPKEDLEAEQKERQKWIDGAKSALDGYAFFLGAVGDPGAERDLKAFASGALQVATAVNECITAFKAIDAVFSMATVAFTGNVLSAVSTLVGLFGAAGPSVEELILKEIEELHKKLDELKENMNERFDAIDRRLSAMYTDIVGQLKRLTGDVATVKGNLMDVAGQLTRIEDRMDNIGVNVTAALAGLYADDAWKQADSKIDYLRYHPGDEFTYDMYKQAEEEFHPAGVDLPKAEGAYVPSERTSTEDGSVLQNLRDFGTFGMIRYLSRYMVRKGWNEGVPEVGPTGNPEMWKIGATAYTLLSAQNPNWAAKPGVNPPGQPGNRWERPGHVIGQGRAILEAAKTFSTPKPDGGINTLFSSLLGEYGTALNGLVNEAQDREHDVTKSAYNLWGGPTQAALIERSGLDGGPKVMKCNSGNLDEYIEVPEKMKGRLLGPAQMLARNVHVDPPKYGVCWYSGFVDERVTERTGLCEADPRPQPCTEKWTYGDLEVHFAQDLKWSDKPAEPSRWGTATVKKDMQLEYCKDIHNGPAFCTKRPNPFEEVVKGWKTGLYQAFDTNVRIGERAETEQDAVDRMTTFLQQARTNYYLDNANYLKTANRAAILNLRAMLLRTYTELGLPQSLKSDMTLRGLLYGAFGVFTNSADEVVPNQLSRIYETAASNLAHGIPAWKQELLSERDAPCAKPEGVRTEDPLLACLAEDGRGRLAKLTERYAAAFKGRKDRSDEALPDVRDQVRNLWLVTKTIHPTAEVGPPVDPIPAKIAVDADYDGDRKEDAAFWRPEDGTWTVRPSTGGPERTTNLGRTGDLPVPADYDGDGKADPAVVRPSENRFLRKAIAGGPVTTTEWPKPGYRPSPGERAGMVTLAGRLSRLAVQFSRESKATDAVNTQRQAVTLWRSLADSGADLARALVVLGSFLTNAGGHDEAIGVTKDGVARFRALGDKSGLAWALNNLGYRYSAAGKASDAVVAQRESRDLYRDLATADPGQRRALALAHVVLGSFAQQAGLHEEAIQAARDGVAVYRELGDWAGLAWALNNLGYRYSAAGKASDAVVAQRESRDLYRVLAAADPAQKPLLGSAYVILGSFAQQAGLHEEAIQAARDGVAVYRELGDKPGLAWALNNLAFRFSAAGEPADAAVAQKEVREIYQALLDGGGAYRPQLADAALQLAKFLIAAGRNEEAKQPAQQAVDLYEQLAAADPAYAPRLKEAREVRARLG
ncbi:tetratricopeptide repeat protein [Amycolatopsis keratiniphila]|uniref:tetratricopeptide repeat protein n=1 Tax=Amycolatopsis keratiniphila TaxID=129921 RepID=UPI0011780D3D|nr:tetratricopeptide repeat protein [Amycolatopsis keratiniphila]